MFLLRKRVITAFKGDFKREAIQAFDELVFEEALVDVDGVKTKQKVLTGYAKGFLSQVTPILVTEGMKAVKLKVPANLPVNAAGELDFMAPIAQKLMSGKKVKIEDFLPVIMEKAMPYIEGFLAKAAGPEAKGEAVAPSGKIGL